MNSRSESSSSLSSSSCSDQRRDGLAQLPRDIGHRAVDPVPHHGVTADEMERAVGYLGVVLSHVLGVVALGETPGPHQLLGALLVTAAGVGIAAEAVRDKGPRRGAGAAKDSG